MMETLRTWNWTNQLVVSGGVVGLGGLGVLAGGLLDFRCPFASVGLACAGCGCSRAVTIAVQDGLGSAFSAQPTAFLLVLVLTLSLVISAVHVMRNEKVGTIKLITPLVVAILVAVVAIVNFGYQLNTNW